MPDGLQPGAVAAHLLGMLARAETVAAPFRHWLLDAILPAPLCAALTALPLSAPALGDTGGKRDTANASRRFLAGPLLADSPACRALAEGLQDPAVPRAVAARTGADLAGCHLRMEYCQDTDGFWLEPHTDIRAKHLTLLVYLCDEPPGARWGTDLMTPDGAVVATAACRTNAGLMFVPGPDTWHGWTRRPLTGVRRTLIVNWVTPDWRARHELAFPDRPVAPWTP